MCGIIGICGKLDKKDFTWLDLASKHLRHRGPDAHGTWVGSKNNVALGHCRLSIIDTSIGNDQPFISKDGKLIIIFNGEIYNYIELRSKLKNLGQKFRTNGDTEVLLAAYQFWGVDCLKYLNGMWAFAIYDQRRGSGREKLFVARDRAGEKPFYYRYNLNRFELASELKGIYPASKIDLNALNHYLALGYIPGDLCIASGVKKLPPAHAGIYDFENGKFRKWRYWELPSHNNRSANSFSIEELAEQSWNLLNDSVKLRLRSDVPTGIFLSGGLDSSLITAAAAKTSSQRLKTFTISIPNSLLDESKHAQLIANSFDTDHHILSLDRPSLYDLHEFSSFIDEPIADSSIIPSYMISRMTRKYVTVALGGDGGDELYGGYHHYQNILRNQAYLGWLPISFFKFISQFASTLPAGTKGRNFISSLREGFFQSSIWGSPYFDIALRKKLFKPEVLAEIGDEIDAPESRTLALYQQGLDPVDRLTRMDFQQALPDNFLVKVDRASMANSLEVRTPFLDYRLIEHAFKEISSEQKVTIKERRIIQNLMAKKHLPKNFALNRKQGFSIPMDTWIRDIPLKEVLLNAQSNYFKKDFINKLIIGQSQKKTNGSRLFSLIMLNLLNIK
jgi:asparagine synthase (glutamine-hydrolysing)